MSHKFKKGELVTITSGEYKGMVGTIHEIGPSWNDDSVDKYAYKVASCNDQGFVLCVTQDNLTQMLHVDNSWQKAWRQMVRDLQHSQNFNYYDGFTKAAHISEFATVMCNVPRRVGKTTFFETLAIPNSILITDRHNKYHFHCGDKNVLTGDQFKNYNYNKRGQRRSLSALLIDEHSSLQSNLSAMNIQEMLGYGVTLEKKFFVFGLSTR